MWPRRELLELFGSRHPILQAPMAGAASAELAGAVSRAGAIGGFGAAATTADELRGVIRRIRSVAGDRPFNINLFTPVPGQAEANPGGEAEIRRALAPLHREVAAGSVPELAKLFTGYEQQVEVVLEEAVPILSVHFGVAAREHLEALQQGGCRVIATATSVEEARILEQAGVDAVIAQGLEAGGHQGTFQRELSTRLSTLTLVPAVVDAVQVPVIAAGGLVDGRSIAAALALGAAGVQLGTAFLTCRENAIHREYTNALLSSSGEDTVLTSAISGRPARGIRNRLIETLEPLDRLRYPEHYSLTRRLRSAAAREDRGDMMAMWAGLGVGRVTEEPTAAELIERLAEETQSVLRGLVTTDPERGETA